MLQEALKMRGDRKTIVDAMNAITAKGAAMTQEDLESYGKMDTDQSALKAKIDAIEKSDTLDKEMNAKLVRRASETGRTVGEIEGAEAELIHVTNHFLRRGLNGMNDEQKAIAVGRIGQMKNDAQSTVVGTEGGYTVPVTMADGIIDAEKFEGGMIDPGIAYTYKTDTGGVLNVPTDNDTNNEGEIVAQNADVSAAGAGVGISFGNVGMSAHLFSSKMVLVPLSLLNDSAFDLVGFLTRKLGERLGRVENRKFTLGTGASEPTGIVPASAVGFTCAAGETTSIIFNDLVELEHSVDAAYRKGARFMFADSSLKVIKKMVDGVGRPLWLSGVALKEPDTINGYPYTINTKMADMAVSAKSIAFGNFQKYWIRRVQGITILRLNERFADKGQVAFIAFERADGQLVDAGTHPVKLLQQAAS